MRIEPEHIALVFMIAGTLSLALNEQLARLDSLIIKGGPFLLEQSRERTARRMIVTVGVVLVALALALVVR